MFTHLFRASISIAICGLLGFTSAARADLPLGWHDGIDAQHVTGWSCDPDSFSTPLTISIYRSPNWWLAAPWNEAEYLGYATTQVYRPDVAAANVCGSYDAGLFKGFDFAFPSWASNGQGYYVYTVATDIGPGNSYTGQQKILNNSPLYVQFPALPRGWQDIIDSDRSQGWSCDPDNYASALNVHFYRSANPNLVAPWNYGEYLGSTSTQVYRPDVASGLACGTYGDGLYKGFDFTFPGWSKNAQGYYVYAVSSDINANGNATGQYKNLNNSPLWTVFTATPTCTGGNPSAPVAYGASGTFRVYATGVQNATRVLFKGYAAPNGADDLVAYEGVNLGSGTWYADIDLSRHATGSPQYGAFNVDLFAINAGMPNGNYCGAFSFTRDMVLQFREFTGYTGLWDVGFNSGYWRTDYNSAATGTIADPVVLTTPCTYPADGLIIVPGAGPSWPDNPCKHQADPADPFLQDNVQGKPYWAQSNATAKGGPQNFGGGNFWVVTANNERAFNNLRASNGGPLCNSGPPNQSFPITENGSSIASIVHDRGGYDPTQSQITLTTNNAFAPPGCQDPRIDEGLIFLSLGADTFRGNNGVITYLNSVTSPKHLQFSASSWHTNTPSSAKLLLEAYADGARKWIFIFLDSAQVRVQKHWNWNIEQSLWAGGADLAVYGVSDLAFCSEQNLSVGTLPLINAGMQTYDINLQNLFRCVSNNAGWANGVTIPTNSAIPITGVHFAIEQNSLLGRGAYPTTPHSTSLTVKGLRIVQ